MWHMNPAASDGGYSASQEFYADSSNILEFASRLLSFPNKISDTIDFEIGSQIRSGRAGYHFGFALWME